jgi:hypothetical protein
MEEIVQNDPGFFSYIDYQFDYICLGLDKTIDVWYKILEITIMGIVQNSLYTLAAITVKILVVILTRS